MINSLLARKLEEFTQIETFKLNDKEIGLNKMESYEKAVIDFWFEEEKQYKKYIQDSKKICLDKYKQVFFAYKAKSNSSNDFADELNKKRAIQKNIKNIAERVLELDTNPKRNVFERTLEFLIKTGFLSKEEKEVLKAILLAGELKTYKEKFSFLAETFEKVMENVCHFKVMIEIPKEQALSSIKEAKEVMEEEWGFKQKLDYRFPELFKLLMIPALFFVFSGCLANFLFNFNVTDKGFDLLLVAFSFGLFLYTQKKFHFIKKIEVAFDGVFSNNLILMAMGWVNSCFREEGFEYNFYSCRVEEVFGLKNASLKHIALFIKIASNKDYKDLLGVKGIEKDFINNLTGLEKSIQNENIEQIKHFEKKIMLNVDDIIKLPKTTQERLNNFKKEVGKERVISLL